MKVMTLFFGELEYEDNEVIVFHQGIPGFEEFKKYLKIQQDNEVPFFYLQSVEEGNLSFLVTDPFLFFPDYDFQLSKENQLELGINEEASIEVFTIVTVYGNYIKATTNLLAPIVINNITKVGKQIILHDSEYKTKHELLMEETSEDVTKGSV
jgi:flagellar assembly factor FliW